jgi:murein DD-endopeptidase MepM/ murein hydrolase activator NlpD
LAIEVADRLKEIFFNAPVYEELIYSEPVYNKLDSTEPVWPFDKSKVTRELKNWPTYTDGTYHAGTDFAIPLGSDIYSAYSGVVDTVKDLGAASYGKYIVIKSIIDGNVRYIYYGHLNEQMVQEGDRVMAGDKIGESGTTGYSTGPHLHYEVRNENKNHGSLDNPSLNPYDYLPKSK